MNLSIFQKPTFNIHQLNIRSYEVGFNWEVTLPSVFNYFQEIAWEHAKMLGFGWEDLQKDELFWALARIRVKILKLPKWTDNVTLVTYPCGIDGLFAIRDYEMYDSNGDQLVMGTSSWLILSQLTRRPIRTADYMGGRRTVDRRSLPEFASKIDSYPGIPHYSYKIPVSIGDIDVNSHVNNVRYIEWALNSIDYEYFKTHSPELIEVNFLTEGLPGNNILVERFNKSEYENIINIKREIDIKDLCKVYIRWKLKG